jgi:hypothetical protein
VLAPASQELSKQGLGQDRRPKRPRCRVVPAPKKAKNSRITIDGRQPVTLSPHSPSSPPKASRVVQHTIHKQRYQAHVWSSPYHTLRPFPHCDIVAQNHCWRRLPLVYGLNPGLFGGKCPLRPGTCSRRVEPTSLPWPDLGTFAVRPTILDLWSPFWCRCHSLSRVQQRCKDL